jgi:hypothetical protein
VKLDAILHALDHADDQILEIEEFTEKEIVQYQQEVRSAAGNEPGPV